MRRLLVSSVAALALGATAVPSGRAFGPGCQPCPVFPFQLEQRTITCYRTETRTELRPVERTVCRQVPETTVQDFKEQVLVHFWRDEERKKEVIVVTPTDEKRSRTVFSVECKDEQRVKTRMEPECKDVERPCPSLVVGCADEKRAKTVMVEESKEETRSRTVFTLKTEPKLVVKRYVAVELALPACGCGGGLPAMCLKVAQVHTEASVENHLMPEPRDQTYKVPVCEYRTKELPYTVSVPTFKEAPPVKVPECNYREVKEPYTAHVIEVTPKEQPYTVPVCEYKGKEVPCEKVKVLDVREETRTHRLPVTTCRTVSEVVVEMVPCKVTVQVPYQTQVWVPVCK